jgi:hypothetical protein
VRGEGERRGRTFEASNSVDFHNRFCNLLLQPPAVKDGRKEKHAEKEKQSQGLVV